MEQTNRSPRDRSASVTTSPPLNVAHLDQRAGRAALEALEGTHGVTVLATLEHGSSLVPQWLVEARAPRGQHWRVRSHRLYEAACELAAGLERTAE